MIFDFDTAVKVRKREDGFYEKDTFDVSNAMPIPGPVGEVLSAMQKPPEQLEAEQEEKTKAEVTDWVLSHEKELAVAKAGLMTAVTAGAYPVIQGVTGAVTNEDDLMMDRVTRGILYPEQTKGLYTKLPGGGNVTGGWAILAGVSEDIIKYGVAGILQGGLKTKLLARSLARDVDRAATVQAKEMVGEIPKDKALISTDKAGFARKIDETKSRLINAYMEKLSAIDTDTMQTGWQQLAAKKNLIGMLVQDLKSMGRAGQVRIGQSVTVQSKGKDIVGKVIEVIGNRVTVEAEGRQIIAMMSQLKLPELPEKEEFIKGHPQAKEVFETAKGELLDSLNPTGSVFSEYTPEKRAKFPLGENITTLDKTMNKSPDEMITVYRGGLGEIVPGDFVTTNKQLAKDYAGTNKVFEKKVKLSDILDDKTEPLGEEYIYRPTHQEKGIKYNLVAPKVITKLQGKIESLKSDKEKYDMAKETLKQMNDLRYEFTGRMKRYAGGKQAEETAEIPKVYITTSKFGSTPDDIMQEMRDKYGMEFNSETDLVDYLKGLESGKKSMEYEMEKYGPKMVSMRESTLAKKELKAAESVKKESQRQMEKVMTQQEKEMARAEKKSFREGRKVEAELRKKRYFGSEITPEQRKELYVVALNKGVIYTDYSGKTHDKLHGIIRYYKGASFDQLKNYLSNLSGEKGNPPKLFKLYGDINKDAEAMKIINEERKDWQDITPAEVYTLDPPRIVEKVSKRPTYTENSLADNTFNVIASADEAMFDRKMKESAELNANRQGVHANSKESAEIMRKFEAGEPLDEKQQKVADFLRSKYEMWINEANDMRALLGKKPISHRENYMTHIIESNMLHDFFLGSEQGMGVISNEQMDAIRKGDYTKGNMPFNRFAQQRLGEKTKFDAIGNYIKYMNTMAREIYYTPAISHSRKFIEYALMEQPNAYKAIDRMLSDLKGKKSIVDQNLIGWIASSAQIQWLRTHIARSALVGNINFWTMNMSNFATAYPELGNWVNFGMSKFLGNKEWREFAFKNSKMLKARQIDPDFIDQPVPTKIEEVVASVTNLIEYNNIGSVFTGAYHKAIDELGYSQEKAIEYADSLARKTQVGYKAYEVNAWMRSNSGKLFSQFQNWSFNAMNYILYDVGAANIPEDIASIFKENKTNRTRWKALFGLIATAISVNQIYRHFGLREPYEPTAAIPSVAGLDVGKYGDIGPVRVLKNAKTAITGKKKETREKAAQKVVGSVIPGGTQAVRFLQGNVFPENKEGKKKKKIRD